jgi:hypothetical protein
VSPYLTLKQLLNVAEVIHLSAQHPVTQKLLLRSIQPRTPRINIFRCRLALSFFFNDMTLLDTPAEHVLSIHRVNRKLRRLHLQLDDHTDYAELSALAFILDAAIDRGIPPGSPLDKTSENAFNNEVDAVAKKIKTIFTAMADSGASHLKRGETKERFEALYFRLIYAVRTRPPPKMSVFGDSFAEDTVQSSDFMQKFLARRAESRVGTHTERIDESIAEEGRDSQGSDWIKPLK